MKQIEVIGLGAGDIEQLPLGIYRKLTQAQQTIYARTNDHPVIKVLEAERVSFTSFDTLYEEEEQFDTVYARITAQLVEAAKTSEDTVIYAVPGHPMLAEKTVQLLLEQNEVEVLIAGGQSYLDDLFTAMQIDPIEGFQFVDGTDFRRDQLHFGNHLFVCQVYDMFIASEVKLTLLEDLPPAYEVYIVEAAGSRAEKIEKVRLEELDHRMEISNLTTLYIPPVPKGYLHHTFPFLREVMAILRGPDGCPWDKKQTHESLRHHTIEEVYELIEAIDEEDDDHIVEELGDLLMHILLHSQIGEDNGYFTIDDVIQSISDKMIYRHPHVFGGATADTEETVLENWEELKKQEKGKERESVLDGIPVHLPALAKAYKLVSKAGKVGFEWSHVDEVWENLKEEIDEVIEAVQDKDLTDVEEELGDVLFVLANISRYYKVNPEVALERANRKFISRFQYIENKLEEKRQSPETASLQEMDAYWEEAKKNQAMRGEER
ncbi:Nucleoside triphosphate pyrophosphohydrolase/pyrophosphatase MazG [Oceanobacillus oncorhynchi]|uniref:Nucleoside triphosphate pyrophosphohydrolase/pyrophosphatase MazG n=1 Tax=Oceanobacillus oncorhynchi TaxID=545501 RepID=A0A0A1MM79_9BACI|nr:nucleoside triphosphate pyrophosphohydrolase [Oceanobacillus oncorhynchi]CEI80226.1 Nucleoside triphosphate pyrophosphohydrolase/pyrophosphatase MazG [Oceanobacillus oncorhynchi]